MTAQIAESIFYKGGWESMSTEPLEDYLKTRPDIKFRSVISACWRGYFGSWKIKEDKLYLTDLEGLIVDVGEVNLNHLFPNQDEVFAEWYTGTITLPRGEMLDYVHMGYYTLYEYDLLIEIKNGRVVKEEMRSNYEEYKRRLEKKDREKSERELRERQERERKEREAKNPELRKRRERVELARKKQAERQAKRLKLCDKIGQLIIALYIVMFLIIGGWATFRFIREGVTWVSTFPVALSITLLMLVVVLIYDYKDKVSDTMIIATVFSLIVSLIIGGVIGVCFLIQLGEIWAYIIAGVMVIPFFYHLPSAVVRGIKIFLGKE